jgi:hypothetical protein
MNRIETSHIDRSLMNRLVMNYLVTGSLGSVYFCLFICFFFNLY